MIVGATVFAALILLLLLAERGSGFVWHEGREQPTFYCAPCDLRYPLVELGDAATGRCPRGHPVVPVRQPFPVGTFLIVVCVVFVAIGGLLIATGRTPGP